MTDTALGRDPESPSLREVRAAYAAMTRTKQMYGGIVLLVFVALMASGFSAGRQPHAAGSGTVS